MENKEFKAMKSSEKTQLAILRSQLAVLECGEKVPTVLSVGVPAIDGGLPWGGLPLGMLHEVAGAGAESEDGSVAAAFLAGILARLSPERPVLWCMGRSDLHIPGLAFYGLLPERLILARAPSDREILWAMEEGLRSPALAAVVGEMTFLPAPTSRRLQLAAELSGTTGFALCRGSMTAATSSAVTRWRVSALPGSLAPGEPGIGRPRWRIELLRCRGGMPAIWEVEGRDGEAGDATDHVPLPALLADRPAWPQRRASG